ncbi:putative vacuolar protein sorting-associated protein [Corchorus olitorius]|uniref:Vacuolar protein sorting-associated protein n=1 Tax=Corchorus olitorius TaxID=93759 RepID=A0A1R3HSA2_9ROSI|nr:putative vacuolar protein sorting-associated protein [Corchorus olitorius]
MAASVVIPPTMDQNFWKKTAGFPPYPGALKGFIWNTTVLTSFSKKGALRI